MPSFMRLKQGIGRRSTRPPTLLASCLRTNGREGARRATGDREMDGSPAGGSRTGRISGAAGLALFPMRSLRRVTNTKTQFRVSCNANQEVVMSATDVHDTSRDA